ncbi:hypothetical protein H2200_009794 [Cladophialophora chaetospira]|uniref:Metallo-beta-lactamase domain-containing protein n=1 Tax=Cladophialophora chaetospira TaxID=386627 RepID=A0AA39CEW4_9EURO|nr:hypothetical protein H2200_009794 [Cladophialophora chaetospira]
MQDDKGGYRQINKALNICAFEDYLKVQTASLPRIADVEKLTGRVLRILGQNPGKFTLQGTNTYILGTGPRRILIDTGGGEPRWMKLVETTLKSKGISLSHVLLTHWHGDHTGGVPDLLRVYPHLRNSIYKNDPGNGQQNIIDGQVFHAEGATVRAVHTPGHSEDHMCFILEEERAMFTGDNILGHGTSAVEDLGIFMATLQKMYEQKCVTGHSAHGLPISDLPNKLAGELQGKLRRERQVMNALGRFRSRGARSVTIKDLVSEIYGYTIHEETRTLALEPFIDEVLRKLAVDGKVAFERRGSLKKWYSVAAAQTSPGEVKISSTVQVQVQEILVE